MISPAAWADELAADCIGRIQRRTHRGLDVDDKPFAPYSSAYRAALARGGEASNVDLWVTGSMVGDLVVVRKVATADRLELDIGPGAGETEKRTMADGAAKRTGKTVPHSQLAWWHHNGAGRLPARRWIGLSTSDRKAVAQRLRKDGLARIVGTRGSSVFAAR